MSKKIWTPKKTSVVIMGETYRIIANAQIWMQPDDDYLIATEYSRRDKEIRYNVSRVKDDFKEASEYLKASFREMILCIFLEECGIDIHNDRFEFDLEYLISWISKQFPKIYEVYDELGLTPNSIETQEKRKTPIAKESIATLIGVPDPLSKQKGDPRQIIIDEE